MKFDISKVSTGDHDVDTGHRDIVDKGTIRVGDMIAPDAIENEVNYVKIGNRLLRTLMVTGYPRTVMMGWLNELYSYPANIDISTHVEPMSTTEVIKILNRKIGQYVSTLNMSDKQGKVPDISVETALGDATDLRDKLHKNMEKLYYRSMYIMVSGKNEDELNYLTEEIETLCEKAGMITRHAMYQQTLGFHTMLPIADDRLRFRRNFDTSSLATCFPFVSAELTRMAGDPILYGTNLLNESLVMFDRYKLPNHNSVILASSGAGKSYFVKLESWRYMSMGTQILTIDPQGEYSNIASAVGGQVIKLSANSEDRINPLDIDLSNQEGDDEKISSKLAAKVMDVYSILEVMIGEKMDAEEKKVVLDALEHTYEKFGITREGYRGAQESFIEGERFKMSGAKKKMPTLSDLEKSLSKSNIGIKINQKLHPYIHGFMSLFNGETNINSESKYIVFDISEMEKELADLTMFIVLEFIWNKIKSGDLKKRLLVIDEAWMLMQNEQSADYLVRVSKTARKFNAGMSIISQQAKDFIENGGEKIIGNTSMQILLRQHQNDIGVVSDMFGLSENERQLLRTANVGEALIFADGNHTFAQVDSSPFEHIICSTNPEDQKELRKMIEEEGLFEED